MTEHEMAATVEEIRALEDKLAVLAYFAADGASAEWQYFAYSRWGWLTPGTAGYALKAEEIVKYGPFVVLTPTVKETQKSPAPYGYVLRNGRMVPQKSPEEKRVRWR